MDKDNNMFMIGLVLLAAIVFLAVYLYFDPDDTEEINATEINNTPIPGKDYGVLDTAQSLATGTPQFLNVTGLNPFTGKPYVLNATTGAPVYETEAQWEAAQNASWKAVIEEKNKGNVKRFFSFLGI